jgi:hypothetical protein
VVAEEELPAVVDGEGDPAQEADDDGRVAVGAPTVVVVGDDQAGA